MASSDSFASRSWLALVIGNSRSHWAEFTGTHLESTWNTAHFSPEVIQHLLESPAEFEQSLSPTDATAPPDLWIASVVPEQAARWQAYPSVHWITLAQVPLKGMYPTLGVDRALAGWGGLVTVGGPVLVIDAGTALTFTGIDGEGQLVGGAILPGLRLQFQALGQATAALPTVGTFDTPPLPSLWAMNTVDAISSGVVHTLLAGLHSFMKDWWRLFPGSPVLLTGGDGERLHRYLKQQLPALATKVRLEPNLIFWGMREIKLRLDRSA